MPLEAIIYYAGDFFPPLFTPDIAEFFMPLEVIIAIYDAARRYYFATPRRLIVSLYARYAIATLIFFRLC